MFRKLNAKTKKINKIFKILKFDYKKRNIRNKNYFLIEAIAL